MTEVIIVFMDGAIITEVTGCFKLLTEPEGPQNCISRPYHCLVLFLEGESEFHFESVFLKAGPGTIVYLPYGSNYRVQRNCPGKCYYYDFMISGCTMSEPLLWKFDDISLWEDLFTKSAKVYQRRRIGFEFELMGLLYQAISFIQKAQSIGYLPTSQIKRLEYTIDFIKQNYCSGEIRVSELAHLAGISSRYYTKLFSTYLGMSPKEYILKLQVDNARNMLIGSGKPITQIASECGFSDVYYFSKIFRKRIGVSPSEYRKGGSIL